MGIIGNGAAKHKARLARLSSPALINNVGLALLATGKVIEEDIRFNMNDGAISGPGHIPSLPGESPLSDTHALEQSIHVTELERTPDAIQTTVQEGGPSAPYAAALEYGFGNIAERPHMRPATERARKNNRNGVRDAVTKTVLGK